MIQNKNENNNTHKIHSLYNPVIFEFDGTRRSTDRVSIVLVNPDGTTQPFIDIDLLFYNNKSKIDIGNFLRSAMEVRLSNTAYADPSLTLKYAIAYENDDFQTQTTEGFTALNYAAQIMQPHGLSGIENKLLTAFKSIITYFDYPRDVSVFAEEHTEWLGTLLGGGYVNRLPISCPALSGSMVEILPSLHGTAEYIDFVCRKTTNGNNTGEAYATAIVYTKYLGADIINAIQKDLLTDVAPAKTIAQFQLLTPEEVESRAAFLNQIAVTFGDLVILNNPVKTDNVQCPLLVLQVNGKSAENISIQNDGAGILLTAGGAWQAAYDSTKLSVTSSSGAAGDAIYVHISPTQAYQGFSEQVVFSLVGNPSTTATLYVDYAVSTETISVTVTEMAGVSQSKGSVIFRTDKNGGVEIERSFAIVNGVWTMEPIPVSEITGKGCQWVQISVDEHIYGGNLYYRASTKITEQSHSAGLTPEAQSWQTPSNLYFAINPDFGKQNEDIKITVEHKEGT